jgi:hypothetical protein
VLGGSIVVKYLKKVNPFEMKNVHVSEFQSHTINPLSTTNPIHSPTTTLVTGPALTSCIFSRDFKLKITIPSFVPQTIISFECDKYADWHGTS